MIEFTEKYESAETTKSLAVKELSDLKNEESRREATIESLVKNEEIREKQMSSLKAKIEQLTVENDFLKKEAERAKSQAETKINALIETNNSKLHLLEKESEKQRNAFETSSKKAFEVVKKQENWNNTWKEEFGAMVNYYEKKLKMLGQDNENLRRYLQNEEYH